MRTAKARFEIRKNRIRTKISKVAERLRLSVFKSNKHLYAQLIDDQNSTTIAAISTLNKEIRKLKKSNCNIDSAAKIGELIGKKAKEKGIEKVVFDKGGYKYHGVIKALADAARQELEF